VNLSLPELLCWVSYALGFLIVPVVYGGGGGVEAELGGVLFNLPKRKIVGYTE